MKSIKNAYKNYTSAAEALNNVDAAQAKALEAKAVKAEQYKLANEKHAESIAKFEAHEKAAKAFDVVKNAKPKDSYVLAENLEIGSAALAAYAEHVRFTQIDADASDLANKANKAFAKTTEQAEAAKTAAADAFESPRLKSATENKAFRKAFAAPYNACSALSSACSRLWASIKDPKGTAQYCATKIWDNKGKLAFGVAAVAILACGYKNQTVVIKGLEVASKQLCNQASKGLSFVAKVAAQGASVLAR